MKDLASLAAAIAAHQAWDGQERAMQQTYLAFLQQQPQALHRSLLMGHVTASAWVLDIGAEAALMIHHRKLDRWLQPGGHADGEADTLSVATREVWEETGLETLPLIGGIFDLDIHLIPQRGAEPAHLHYDVRHLLQPAPGARLRLNHEVKAAQWVKLAEVTRLTQEPSVLRMVEKSRAFLDGRSSLHEM